MFLAAAQDNLDGKTVRVILDDEANRGDYADTGKPRDHGTPQHNGAWYRWGFEQNRTAECNTWLAGSDDVS